MVRLLGFLIPTFLFCLCYAIPVTPEKPKLNPPPIKIFSQHQLFIDDHLIEKMPGLTKTLHQPQDYRGNPVIVPEKPWEHRRIPFGSVYYFPQEKKFKCWYLTVNFRDSRPSYRSGKSKPTIPLYESAFICYAESTDGIHWTKPNLGLFAYRGSKQNNIVMTHRGSHFDSISVIYTPHDVDKPYKLVVFQGRWPYKKELIKKVWGPDFQFGISQPAHYAWHSKDGIHFTPYNNGEPVLRANDRSMFWYDPRREVYVGSAKSTYQGKRAHRYVWSKDLVDWRVTDDWIMRADEQDHPRDQIDGAYGFAYGAGYVGYCEMRRVRDSGARIDQELMTSLDGRHWTRPIRQAFIPFGEKASWRYGVIKIFANPPIQRDGRLWLYYGGSTGAVDYKTSDEPFQALSLATLRQDGFVSLDGGEQGGTLITRPVLLAGDKLNLNADAKGGEICVELRDMQNKPIPGFTADRCRPITTNNLAAAIAWNGKDSLAALRSMPVRLAISIRNAQLYSLWTEEGPR